MESRKEIAEVREGGFRKVIVVVLLLLLLAPVFTAHTADQTILIELPTGVLPSAVGANGSVVVGAYREPSGFYWMPTTGDIFLGGKGAFGVSRDGRTIVGTAVDTRGFEQAAIWQRAAEWRLLGSIVPNAAPCDALLSSSYGTSDDGSVVVGLAWNGCNVARAFRWEEATGMVDLGSTVAGRSSRANGVSGDGSMVIGWQEHTTGPRQGARWVSGRQELFAGPVGPVGEAHAANTDGSIVVGQWCRPGDPLNQSAWVWTSRDGLECVPPPRLRLGFFLGMMLATSNDGRVIGGAQSFGLESEAVLWIDRSPVYLKDYLRANGVPNAFDGWVNTGFINGVSPDGRVLVGYGAGRRDFQGYIVILGSNGVMP
jgi:probable HAF family extracellular repeat protein